MLKDCWNKNLPPSEFAALLFKPNTNTQQILTELVSYCSTPEDPPALFLDYLNEAVMRTPHMAVGVITKDTEIEKLITQRIISRNPGSFFANFPFDDEWPIKFALNLLRSLIDDKAIYTIQQLSLDSHFSALIAKSNMLFPKEMDEIRELFPIEQFYEFIGYSIPYPSNLLKKAIYMENSSSSLIGGYHDVLKIVIPNISAILGIPHFFHLINLDQFAHIYIHFVYDFINNPTIVNAFYITDYFPRMRKYFETGETPDKRDGELHAGEIFKTLDLCKEYISKAEFLANHSKRSDCDILFNKEDIESLKNLLTTIPDTIDPDKIIDLTLMYPALSISLYTTITKSISIDTAQVFAMYAQQLLNIHNDFATFLFQQDLFFDFLNLVIPVVTAVTDRFAFCPIWMLFLTLIRDSYGLGWQKLNNEIVEFINSLENQALKYFLTLLIHLNPQEYECPKTAKTPFLECVITMQKLIYDEVSIESIDMKLDSRPYLAPSLLIFCLSNPSEEIKKYFSVKPSDLYLNNLFIYHLMIYCNKQQQPWVAGSELPDFIFMKHESPQKLDSINQILSKMFDSIIFTIPLTSTIIWHIVCAWRAWGNIFGITTFVKHLFGQLLWKAKLLANQQCAENLFYNVAIIMCMAFAEEENFVNDINSIVDYFLVEGENDKIDGQNIAAFVLILIAAMMNDDTAKAFDKLIVTCVEIIDKGQNVWKVKFALTLLSFAINNVKLVGKLGLNVELCLQKANEMELLSNYYIMKVITQEKSK